jgi:hypothetical protein
MKKFIFVGLVVVFLMVAGGAGAQSPIVTPTPDGGGEDGGVGLPPVSLSGAWIAAFLAAGLSFGLAYIPGAQEWWSAWSYKRETFLVAGVVVDLALVGLHYAGAIDLGLGAFGWPVVERAGRALLGFLGAAQGAFMVQRWLAPMGKAGNV